MIGAGEGQAHLLGYIGRGGDARIAGKGHHAVDLQLARGLKNRVLVDAGDVAVLVGTLVGGIIGQIVAGDDVDAEVVGFPDHGQKITGTAQKQQLFHGILLHSLYPRCLL